MLRGLQFIRKKLLRAAIYKKSSQNKLNLIQHYTLGIFLRCSRSARMHLAGHMRPAGRLFEIPGLTCHCEINRNKTHIFYRVDSSILSHLQKMRKRRHCQKVSMQWEPAASLRKYKEKKISQLWWKQKNVRNWKKVEKEKGRQKRPINSDIFLLPLLLNFYNLQIGSVFAWNTHQPLIPRFGTRKSALIFRGHSFQL